MLACLPARHHGAGLRPGRVKENVTMVGRWKCVWLAAITLAASPASAGDGALKSLVAAERAFAATSVRQGIKPSFLKYLAADGIVFRPTATNGRKAFEEKPASAAKLTWEPAYAEISAAGDLGITTGPWELHFPAERNLPPAYGHFISVWKKPRGGTWHVAVDIGISHDKPASGGVGSGEFEAGPTHVAGRSGTPAIALRSLDQACSEAARARGMAAAFASQAAEDVRLNTEGAFPLVGLERARAQIAQVPGIFRFLSEGSGLAASGDLGYTYGIAQRFESGATVAADSSVYLHVWRGSADQKWKLAIEVLNPLTRR